MLSDSDGGGGGGGGVGEAWLTDWKRSLLTASACLGILGGSVLSTSPGLLLPGGGDSSVAMAAMAPSLMQDEKGYISIFEKVRHACE